MFVMRPSPRAAACVLVALLAACGGGTTAPPATPGGTAPSATPTPTGAPTAPSLPAASPFTVTQAVALSGKAQTVTLPAASGFGGSLALPAPSNLPPDTVLAMTFADTSAGLTTNVPALDVKRARGTRGVASNAPMSVLLYLQVAFSEDVALPNPPSLNVTVPAGLPSAAYYVALFDPTEPSFGWQLGFEGPASVGATSLSFVPATSAPLGITAEVPYTLAVYAISAAAASPTPAPSGSPLAYATPVPFTLSPSSANLLAPGQTATATIVDPTGYTGTYVALSTNPSVATVSVSGTTLTITAVGAGTATIGVSDAQARTASLSAGVTTTTLPVQ
jgi:hypothetical protein